MMRDIGEELGLSPEQMNNFLYVLYEVELDIEVSQDGSANIVAVNDLALKGPVSA